MLGTDEDRRNAAMLLGLSEEKANLCDWSDTEENHNAGSEKLKYLVNVLCYAFSDESELESIEDQEGIPSWDTISQMQDGNAIRAINQDIVGSMVGTFLNVVQLEEGVRRDIHTAAPAI